MKHFKRLCFLTALISLLLLSACQTKQDLQGTACSKHADGDNNGVCDICYKTVYVYFDFYAINDLHGKLDDADSHPGVDELTTFLKDMRETDENAVFLSAGDMWQGSSESNMTKGLIVTDWMNELDFTAMAIGNHEYDWGEAYIESNEKQAEFPFLAINIYDRETNKPASYCAPSTVFEEDGLQIGVIGAIGDCYSSIAEDKSKDVYFKVGDELTELVKREATRLRNGGVDFIVYLLHDGYGKTQGDSVKQINASQISSYYDISLSDGYVDLVFEGHTHQGYVLQDEYGVYHLQNRGDNKGGIAHAEVAINTVTQDSAVRVARLISTDKYKLLDDDPLIDELLEKYEEQIAPANEVIGFNSAKRRSDYLCQLMADLYYEFGVEQWGDEYDITLAGGYIATRSPYYLSAGNVTYAGIQNIFPFDNNFALCSISGRDLRNKFLQTSNSDYYICCKDDAASTNQSLDLYATYYVVVDTYTAYYAPNRLTVIEIYEKDYFPRDLLADYVKRDGLS